MEVLLKYSMLQQVTLSHGINSILSVPRSCVLCGAVRPTAPSLAAVGGLTTTAENASFTLALRLNINFPLRGTLHAVLATDLGERGALLIYSVLLLVVCLRSGGEGGHGVVSPPCKYSYQRQRMICVCLPVADIRYICFFS